MSPNQGQVWNLMARRHRQPADRRPDHRQERQPGHRRRPPTAPRGGSSWPCPPRPATPPQDAVYEGWLYAAVATPAGALRRPLRDQGLRPELDQGPHPHPAARDQRRHRVQPGHPDQRRQPARLSPSSARPSSPRATTTSCLAVDPTNPNVIYLGGTADGNQTGLIRIDPTDHLGRPRPGRLLRQRQRRRRARPDLHRPGHGRHQRSRLSRSPASSSTPARTSTSSATRRTRSWPAATLHVFNYASFTNNGAGRRVDPVRRGRDRLPPRRHDDRPDHRPAAADLRQRPGGLERPGQQRDVRDPDRQLRSAAPASTATATSRSPSSTTGRRSPAAPRPRSPAPCSTAAPRTTAARSRTPTSSATATSPGAGPAATPPAWPPTSRATARSTSTSGPAAAATTPTSSSHVQTAVRRPDLRPAPGQQRPAHPRPAVAVRPAVANFAVNPVNGNDVVISSAVGRIFSTTDAGRAPGSTSATRRSSAAPARFSVALAYGAPDPNAPEGVGNLGNFIYVGTTTGQIYVTQDGGGSGTSNNWLNISARPRRLGHRADHHRPDPRQPRRLCRHHHRRLLHQGLGPAGEQPHQQADAWINITGNIHNLAYYDLRPDLRPDDRPELDQVQPGHGR